MKLSFFRSFFGLAEADARPAPSSSEDDAPEDDASRCFFFTRAARIFFRGMVFLSRRWRTWTPEYLVVLDIPLSEREKIVST